MKNIWKKILCVVLILVLGLEAAPTYNTMAATKLTSNQKKTYRKCLKNYCNQDIFHEDIFTIADNKKNTVFALEDVNLDGKKELLVRTEMNAYYQNGMVYLSNGKIPTVKRYSGYSREWEKVTDVNETLIFVSEISKKGFKVYSNRGPGRKWETYYTATSKGTIVEYADCDYDMSFPESNSYRVKGKEVSKAQFDKAIKKLGTFKKINYHKYTASNLKKYL